MSPSDVSRRLQEIRVNLETAVELMERDRPGDWETLMLTQYINIVTYKYHLHVIFLLCPSSGEALRLLERTQSESGLILEETHPLQGELADATARAYATMGENNSLYVCLHMGCVSYTATVAYGGEELV